MDKLTLYGEEAQDTTASRAVYAMLLLMNTETIAWIAGLLEGEGHWSWRPVKGKNWGRYTIQVKMTDRDIVDRLLRLTGMGYVYELGIPGSNSRKEAYLWQVNKKADIKVILEAILPWLGERRKAQAEEVLNRLK